ncbi:unnamed protein product [Zymoseptoria tritici ST99CH_3D1]|uniref:Sugar phosphate transporter domain-containing protein n=3 Tax=Zymoseptoria tritici TaxID=1047171 RepID=F9XIU4_ZYMTI|nr:uncharacterized protein MYCGRDRAFT_75599 [Zymoseptoria tritici IPO323]EGP84389.1 hypothetical protein MYCGRDRAFT_75599 [Zymoseptoria tritici IPO323]SMQ54111.1 unnamed protein product [Zymoseptoria tritici ST99CH_3D7]SMR58546.1 unnamed protein product [Zymoseptoria tritici ST99CH_1E4]SMR61538.1 unnamed protein product [Zymoseptoria tritici ST99CH_3D1]
MEGARLMQFGTEDDEEKELQTQERRQSLPQWDVSENTRTRFIDFLCVALNASSTVLIVFLNKYTLSDPQLRKSQILMAIWHFAATFFVLLLATRKPWRLFEPVRLPALQVLPLSAFFAGFLVLNNLSLAHNPVGFYQLSKILTTPSVVFINFLVFQKTIPREQFLAVLVTCVGVGLVSVQSFKGNALGTGIACAAFTTTACYQIWIGKKMADLKVDAPQLLLNQSVTAVALLIPVSMLVDVFPDFSTISTPTLLSLVAGGFVASLLNLSQFLIIGRTSALTFNIVSNVKMIAILSLGWYTEGKTFTLLDIMGVLLALVGAWQYAVWGRK